MKDTKCKTKFFFNAIIKKKKFLTVLNYNKINRISGNHATDYAEHFMILFFCAKKMKQKEYVHVTFLGNAMCTYGTTTKTE